MSYGGKTVNIPVWVLPGMAEDTVAVHFGYGRRKSGRVGNGLGVDAFPLRTSKAPWFDGGATVTKTGTTYPIAATQNHFLMEERNPVRVVDAEEYRNDPKAVAKLGAARPDPRLSLFPAKEYTGDKWGMSIDLNSCTGCGVCITACQSENNIAVVGKEPGDEDPRDALDPRRHATTRAIPSSRRRTTSRCRASSARTRRASWSARSPRRSTTTKA